MVHNTISCNIFNMLYRIWNGRPARHAGLIGRLYFFFEGLAGRLHIVFYVFYIIFPKQSLAVGVLTVLVKGPRALGRHVVVASAHFRQ